MLDYIECYGIDKYQTSDTAYKIDNMGSVPELIHSLKCRDSYVGLQARSPYNYIRDLDVRGTISDAVICWAGEQYFEKVKLDLTAPYTYTNINHKDGMQFISMDNVTFKRLDTPIKKIAVRELEAIVAGNDIFILHFTETCGYENVRLFENGVSVDVVGESNVKYLVSSTNAVNWIIGSAKHPVDPNKINDLTIRIRGAKAGSKPSKNLVIHAKRGLKLELDSSARDALVLYEYD